MTGKIWTVLKSEFGRRVRSKWFIFITLAGPVFLIGLMVVPSFIGYLASEGNVRTIAVLDGTDVLADAFIAASDQRFQFVPDTDGPDAARAAVEEGTIDGYLVLPASLLQGEGRAIYYSVEGGGLTLEMDLQGVIDTTVDEYRLAESNAPPEIVELLRSRPELQLVKITEEGEQADSTAASSFIGLIMGGFMYVAIFIYGAYVMHGVMEEKQSRVLEIIVSSVRPFELLMGKVLGIGAMGLLQMGAWAAILLLITISAGGIISLFLDPADFNLPVGAGQEELLAAADFAMPAVEPSLFIWFLLFFFGGFLLYASLFAAVGSTVEHQQDAQGLMLPLSALIVIPILFITVIVESPNSTMSIVLSVIPFFSPILMIVRIAVTSVPFWQVLASFLLLCGTFVAAVWVSSRIYRVGILMYGKRPTLKDLVRWFRYQ
jgi:ABC-2 type transport system permease protein